MSHRSNVITPEHLNGAGERTMEEDRREELLTVREVARRLRVDDTTVRRWIKSGALEAITLPHRGKRQAYRIKKSTLDTLLSSSLPLLLPERSADAHRRYDPLLDKTGGGEQRAYVTSASDAKFRETLRSI
jgi:excisionase family DNA binding protein